MAEVTDIQKFIYSFIDNVRNEREGEVKGSAARGMGWMAALAHVLGKIADNMGANLLDLAAGLDKIQSAKKADPKADPDFKGMRENELTAHMQAQTQIMSMFMQAMNTIIKSLGEANTAVARKQG